MIARTSRFALFGMGHRRKLLYQNFALRDALTGECLRRWEACAERFEPGEYRVTLETPAGEARIEEDEAGVWLAERGDRIPLTRSPVRLPRFEGHPHAPLLRALHGELLVNVMPFGPVPNLWVYPRPWYRDAAMMLICLEKTGNLGLAEAWIRGLSRVFDRNNAGMSEADNLGQALYILSRVCDHHHPLVPEILKAAQAFRKEDYLQGKSDYADHPVYQTKWMKFGLRALGLDDPYRIPEVYDSYSALFWMDFRDSHVPGPKFNREECRLYPYLAWAEAHFYGDPPPMSACVDDFPLTWEGGASEAEYWRMEPVSPEAARQRVAFPHTWHAAEMFLYYA